jgi:serine/threonine protein phosphatase PrpC
MLALCFMSTSRAMRTSQAALVSLAFLLAAPAGGEASPRDRPQVTRRIFDPARRAYDRATRSATRWLFQGGVRRGNRPVTVQVGFASRRNKKGTGAPNADHAETATLEENGEILTIVADGVSSRLQGGIDVAERATRHVFENYRRLVEEEPDLASGERLKRAIEVANRALIDELATDYRETYHLSRETRLSDSARLGATTITAVLIQPRTGETSVAWVGDSPCLACQGPLLTELTRPHRSLAAMIWRGEVTGRQAKYPVEEAPTPLGRLIQALLGTRTWEEIDGDRAVNTITSSLGASIWNSPRIDVVTGRFPGRLLLGSDGGLEQVDWDRLARFVTSTTLPPDALAEELVEQAWYSVEESDDATVAVIEARPARARTSAPSLLASFRPRQWLRRQFPVEAHLTRAGRSEARIPASFSHLELAVGKTQRLRIQPRWELDAAHRGGLDAPYLVFVNGGPSPVARLSAGDTATVGRAMTGATIELDDRQVSRQHLELSVAPDGRKLIVRDSSTNGTWLRWY